MYRRGLKPELKKWVKVNADGTLANTIKIAKRAEKAENETFNRNYHQSQTTSNSDMNAILKALQDLTQQLTTTGTYNRPRNTSYN